MNKLNLGILFIYVFIAVGQSQSHENTLLWKVTGNGLQKPLYVFGTMHLVDSVNFTIPKKVEKALQESDFLVTETESPSTISAGTIMKKMVYKQDNLRNYIPDEQEEEFSGLLTEHLGINLSMAEDFKPFFITAMIAIAPYMKKGIKPVSYEEKLEKLSKKKKHIILETIDEQLGFFDQIHDSIEIDMIFYSLRNFSKEKDTMEQLAQFYADEDMDKLGNLLNQSLSPYPQLVEVLLNKRNKNWVEQIKKYDTQKSYFIAVGAGHLGGEKGLLELLKKEDYLVEPVLGD